MADGNQNARDRIAKAADSISDDDTEREDTPTEKRSEGIRKTADQ